jgi:insertion element IS1 protein InsB
MVLIPVKCPYCESTDVRKFGKLNGKQRYECLNKECTHRTFLSEYTYNAYDPKIREKVFFHTVNGNGTRAISRLLHIAKDTVTDILRGFEHDLWYVNYDYLNTNNEEDIDIELVSVDEAEMDEMWSFVQNKSQQCWLWWVIDHNTGEPLAFHFGTRKYSNLDDLLALLKPFKIGTVYADDNPVYGSRLSKTETKLITGKKNTQRIENKHISLRTWCSRLVRKGIRFSKDYNMHKIVIALVINFWFFGRILA